MLGRGLLNRLTQLLRYWLYPMKLISLPTIILLSLLCGKDPTGSHLLTPGLIRVTTRSHSFCMLETSQARRQEEDSCDLAPGRRRQLWQSQTPANHVPSRSQEKGFLSQSTREASSLPSLPLVLTSRSPVPLASTLAATLPLSPRLELPPPLPCPSLTELQSSSSRRVLVFAGPVRSETVADVRQQLIEKTLPYCLEAAPSGSGVCGGRFFVGCFLEHSPSQACHFHYVRPAFALTDGDVNCNYFQGVLMAVE